MKKKHLKKFKTASEMDRALEEADLSAEFASKGILKKPHLKKINLDLPEWIIQQIDRIAEKLGVSRQPLLKIWIHERLQMEVSK